MDNFRKKLEFFFDKKILGDVLEEIDNTFNILIYFKKATIIEIYINSIIFMINGIIRLLS